ncbi:MAG: hypothetical protein ABIM30_06035 [candidate division WOR-3 bacterium]
MFNMMRFGAYVLFSICIGISLWLFGFTTPLTYVLGIDPQTSGATAPTGDAAYGGRPFDLKTFAERIGRLFSSQVEISKLLLLGVAIGAAALTGFSSMYFIPVILLLFIVNFVSVPISPEIIYAQCAQAQNPDSCAEDIGGLPYTIRMPLLLILNSLALMSAISFIRGGV